MSYPITRITPTTPGNERTPSLWRNLWDRFGTDPNLGTLRSDDWKTGHAQALGSENGWWVSEDGVAAATSESFETIEDADGRISLSAVTAVAERGVKAQAGSSLVLSEGVVLPPHASGKSDVVFEAIVDLDVLTNDSLFVGLAESATLVLSITSDMSAIDYIGFHRTNGGDLLFVARNTGGGGTTATPVVVIDTPVTGDVKLGFRVNGSGKIEIFVDGVEIKVNADDGAAITFLSTDTPTDFLGRTLAVTGGDATVVDPSILNCGRIEVYVAE